MSESKHTPGTWVAKWSKYREDTFIVQTNHPSNRIIASFNDDGDGAGEQSIADAHLISAAPDLLVAAKQLDASWTEAFPGGPDGDREWAGGLGQLSDETIAIWRLIRSAIEKATLSSPTREEGVRGND